MLRTLAALVLVALSTSTRAADQWVVYPGGEGPGAGKHIVLVSGDEEYRSEEGLPQLGKILSQHHGFQCTVLFAVDPETGAINPDVRDNIPGLEALQTADLMIIATRMRSLPDEQMRHVVEYVESGRPIIGLRTATHAFEPPADSSYSKWDWRRREEDWNGGFGREVLGETWISHHGHHKVESTRGLIAPGQEAHPIVRGVDDIWGTTDVYGVRLPLPGDSLPLVLGQVLKGMQPDDEPVAGEKNNPMMPIAWTKTWEAPNGETARIFTTTMGAATDLESEGLRRLIVNAAYWCLGMEEQIPEAANVEIVGEYDPTEYGFGGAKKGVKPEEHAL